MEKMYFTIDEEHSLDGINAIIEADNFIPFMKQAQKAIESELDCTVIDIGILPSQWADLPNWVVTPFTVRTERDGEQVNYDLKVIRNSFYPL